MNINKIILICLLFSGCSSSGAPKPKAPLAMDIGLATASKEDQEIERITRIVTRVMKAELSAESPPGVQQDIDQTTKEKAAVAARAAAAEIRKIMPSVIAEILKSPEVKKSVLELSKIASSGAAAGVSETVLGK
jgi:hypothetical protein